MSNYHVKTISPDGRKAKVVFHIPIPIENNSAGVALRTAVSQYIGTFASQVSWIPQSEIDQLEAGELYEHSETVVFEGGITNTQKQTAIDNRYTTLSLSILDKVRVILKFWGKNRDV